MAKNKRKAAKKAAAPAAPKAAKRAKRGKGKAAAARARRASAPTLGEKVFAKTKIRCYGMQAKVKGGKLRPRGFCYAVKKAA